MCSAPRPKRNVQANALSRGSVLSDISSEARKRFAERANAAQDRRYQVRITKQEKNAHLKQKSNMIKKSLGSLLISKLA